MGGVAALGTAALLASLAVRGAEPAPDPNLGFAVPSALAHRSLLLDGTRAGERLVAVGEWGHVVYSDDEGRSWTQARVPTRSTLTGVHFDDASTGWAVGHDAVILRTRDGARTWERVHWAPQEERPLLDVWFRDALNGFAVGAYGYFLVTRDGGDTWAASQVSEDDFHLNHIADAGGGRLFIAAEAGVIYRSDDEGATWRELPSPYEGSLFATLPLDGDALLLLGLRGHLFRSDDAGETWAAIDTGTEAMLTDALRLDGDTIVIGALAGNLLTSTDAGRTFTLHSLPDRLGIARLLPTPGGSLVALGEGGARRLSAQSWR